MEVQLVAVYAIDEVAESTPDPVRVVPETRLGHHAAPAGAHVGLLVDLLYLARVELERLRRLAAEDQHISTVELDARHRLRLNELHVVDLKLRPFLAGNGHAVLPTAAVTLELAARPRVKQVDKQVGAHLGLPVVTRHQVHPPFVHDDSCRVDGLAGQGGDREPIVRLRIIALTRLRRRRATRVATQRDDEAVTYER